MRRQDVKVLSLIFAIFILVGGCESTTQKTNYYSETQVPNKTINSRTDLYDPTGDPAYSYDPVYSPSQRQPTYTPGTPAYQYSYSYSESHGD